MLIINADDWGRSVAETDAALKCFRERRNHICQCPWFFMQDSKRAARLTKDYELDDVGLHLNFSEEFTDKSCSETLKEHHGRIIRFLKRGNMPSFYITRFFEKLSPIATMHRLRSSYGYLRNCRHTSTGIITCTFVPISSWANRFPLA
jgi:hypothetical protein